MRDEVDFFEASGPGRVGLAGADTAMPGRAGHTTLAFHAPVFSEHFQAEYDG